MSFICNGCIENQTHRTNTQSYDEFVQMSESRSDKGIFFFAPGKGECLRQLILIPASRRRVGACSERLSELRRVPYASIICRAPAF